MDVRRVKLPLDDVAAFEIGDCILVSGAIFAGRDAVLPKVCEVFAEGRGAELDCDFAGKALLHTAVSPAGIGPTSSNKLEIEESFPGMCAAGIKLFLGKGALSEETVRVLDEASAVFAVTPPTTALFEQGMKFKRLVAFPELGMEALWELELIDCPAIIAVAHGKSLL